MYSARPSKTPNYRERESPSMRFEVLSLISTFTKSDNSMHLERDEGSNGTNIDPQLVLDKSRPATIPAKESHGPVTLSPASWWSRLRDWGSASPNTASPKSQIVKPSHESTTED